MLPEESRAAERPRQRPPPRSSIRQQILGSYGRLPAGIALVMPPYQPRDRTHRDVALVIPAPAGILLIARVDREHVLPGGSVDDRDVGAAVVEGAVLTGRVHGRRRLAQHAVIPVLVREKA